MYIYNVTLNIDSTIHAEWLVWIEKHIEEVLNTGKFVSAKFTEVLVEDDVGAKTYSIQYTANTREDIDKYYEENAEALRVDGIKKFGDKMLAFRTELRLVKEFYATSKNN